MLQLYRVFRATTESRSGSLAAPLFSDETSGPWLILGPKNWMKASVVGRACGRYERSPNFLCTRFNTLRPRASL